MKIVATNWYSILYYFLSIQMHMWIWKLHLQKCIQSSINILLCSSPFECKIMLKGSFSMLVIPIHACAVLLVHDVYFSCSTPDVGHGDILLCVSLLNVNAMAFKSPTIAYTIPRCIQLISISLCLKYSNCLFCAHAQFFSICRFTSWIWLIYSTNATFPF
jgi:hypothetical protein